MEELTISAEGNQTLDEPPNLSSTPPTQSIELEVEDTGTISTTAGEDNAQILALYYAIALAQSVVVIDKNKAESDDPTAIPGTEVMRVGNDSITQPLPTSNDIRGFKTNDPSPLSTTSVSASTATLDDSIPASYYADSMQASPINNETSDKEWVVPNASSTACSSHEATPWEEKPVEATKPEPIKDQGGGDRASCLLVLLPTNWKALRKMKDGGNEIVVPSEKPFKPPEDPSDHSSDAN